MKSGIFAAALLLLAGCATPVQMVPTGGSRADGTIDMAYEYGLFQKPEINNDQAQSSANQTCNGWGYTGARPFGAYQQRCVYMSNSGCLRFQVTVRYQCTGAPTTRN
jgi:hypothetical protein